MHQLSEKIGNGTTCKVYLGTIKSTTGQNLFSAIKILKNNLHLATMNQFMIEVFAIRHIPYHPHIVNCFEYGQGKYTKNGKQK